MSLCLKIFKHVNILCNSKINLALTLIHLFCKTSMTLPSLTRKSRIQNIACYLNRVCCTVDYRTNERFNRYWSADQQCSLRDVYNDTWCVSSEPHFRVHPPHDVRRRMLVQSHISFHTDLIKLTIEYIYVCMYKLTHIKTEKWY